MPNGTESNMANGPSFDPQARYLQLDERVTNLRSSVTHLEQKVDTGFSNLAGQFTSLAAELRAGQTTKWQLIWPAAAVALSFSVVIGSLAYLPIREDNAETKTNVRELTGVVATLAGELPEKFIPRKETERLSARSAEDRVRNDAAIADLRQGTVTRAEWMERSEAVNVQLSDLGRRIDEINRELGDTYGVRDIILDLKDQVRRLEERLPNGGSY